MSDTLARAITRAAAPGGGARLRTATVAATSPFQVTIDGGTVGAYYLTSYTPAVSDTVSVLVDGQNILVLGVAA